MTTVKYNGHVKVTINLQLHPLDEHYETCNTYESLCIRLVPEDTVMDIIERSHECKFSIDSACMYVKYIIVVFIVIDQ